MGVGKISLNHWCQWNMKIQLYPQILLYLLYGARYCSIIHIMIYVHMWSHMLNYARVLVRHILNEYKSLKT